jgi:hypothetical protein
MRRNSGFDPHGFGMGTMGVDAMPISPSRTWHGTQYTVRPQFEGRETGTAEYDAPGVEEPCLESGHDKKTKILSPVLLNTDELLAHNRPTEAEADLSQLKTIQIDRVYKYRQAYEGSFTCSQSDQADGKQHSIGQRDASSKAFRTPKVCLDFQRVDTAEYSYAVQPGHNHADSMLG